MSQFRGLLDHYEAPTKTVRGREVLAFGKHRGKTIAELPLGYLQWVAERYHPRTEAQRDFVKNCEAELAERERWHDEEVRHNERLDDGND